MTEDEKITLQWMGERCDYALTEARNGNTAPATLLGSNPITEYYFHNIHVLRTISPEQWGLNYPEYLTELTRQRKIQEQQADITEAVGKIKLLEDQNADLLSKVEALSAKLDALIAAQPKPRKPKPAPASIEDEAEGETPAAPPGEGAEESPGSDMES